MQGSLKFKKGSWFGSSPYFADAERIKTITGEKKFVVTTKGRKKILYFLINLCEFPEVFYSPPPDAGAGSTQEGLFKKRRVQAPEIMDLYRSLMI